MVGQSIRQNLGALQVAQLALLTLQKTEQAAPHVQSTDVSSRVK